MLLIPTTTKDQLPYIEKKVLAVNSKYFSPNEVDLLIGHPTTALAKLGWEC